jgi:tetratricopeptide (TPR) repeat protein
LKIPVVVLTDLDKAIASAIESARIDVVGNPNSPEVWGRYGMVLFAHEFESEAAICFAAASTQDSADERWPYYRALCLHKSNPQEAIAILRTRVERFGNEPIVPRQFLVELLLEQGESDEAEQHLSVLIANDPLDARARHAKARLLFMKNRFRECHDEILRFLRDTNQMYDQQISNAKLLANSNRHADAAEIIRIADAQLAERQGKQKTLGLLLAAAMRQIGQNENAEKQSIHATALPDLAWIDPYLQAIAKLRTGKKNDLNRADMAFGRKDYDGSISILLDVIKNYPKEPFAYVFLGRAYNRKGSIAISSGDNKVAVEQFQLARRFLETGLGMDPNSVDAIFRLGFATYNIAILENDSNLLSEVEQLYRKAIELKPDFTRAHFNLGDCLFKQGKYHAAAQSMREAIRIDPTYTEAHVALGVMLFQQNELSESKRHLQIALKTSPDNETAKQLLERIGAKELGFE